MKIVCISDTHFRHRNVIVPDGDVLVHSGDIAFSHGDTLIKKQIDLYYDFSDWFRNQPHKHKIVIAGNHDFLIEKEVFIKASLFKDINYLCDEELIIDGIKFYGTPYQPIFYHWAFNLDEESLKEKWTKIPSDTDVLLTHCPPKGILDSGFGSESLLLKINELKLKLHVFGHIHNPYGVTGKTINGNNTIFVNASVVNQQYLPVNKPIVVNI